MSLAHRLSKSILSPVCCCFLGICALSLGCEQDADRTKRQSVKAFADNIGDALNADDWRTALRLAVIAEKTHPDLPLPLSPVVAQAYWRAGRTEEAERVAAAIPGDTNNPHALWLLATIHLARGEAKEAGRYANRLESVGCECAADWQVIADSSLSLDHLDSLVHALKAAARMAALEPDVRIECWEGSAQFYAAVGREPLNQITQCGDAPLRYAPDSGAPACDVLINGQGPYRLSIDSGAGRNIVLADSVARQLGLPHLGSTLQTTALVENAPAQLTLADEVKVGEIVCRRVPAAVIPWLETSEGGCVGAIGIGVFARKRVTLDFSENKLTVAHSSDITSAGAELRLRIVGDYRLTVPVLIQAENAIAILDTGVSAGMLRSSAADGEQTHLKYGSLGLCIMLSRTRFDQLAGSEPGHAQTMTVRAFGASDSKQCRYVPGIDLSLAGRSFNTVVGMELPFLDKVCSSRDNGVQSDIMIGMNVLRHARSLTIDFPRCRAWLEWGGPIEVPCKQGLP